MNVIAYMLACLLFFRGGGYNGYMIGDKYKKHFEFAEGGRKGKYNEN